MKKIWIISLMLICLCLTSIAVAQNTSVARQWNEVLLEAIRNDFARPTVHARNLFHISAAMYDAWAAYEEDATPYFLGRENSGIFVPFDGIEFDPGQKEFHQTEAIFSRYFSSSNR